MASSSLSLAAFGFHIAANASINYSFISFEMFDVAMPETPLRMLYTYPDLGLVGL